MLLLRFQVHFYLVLHTFLQKLTQVRPYQIQLAQNFINRYEEEVYRPMDTLLRQITRTHTLNFVNNSGLYHAVALRDNAPLIDLTERFNRFHRDLVEPIASYVLQLISELGDLTAYPYNPHERFTALLISLSDRERELYDIIHMNDLLPC